LSGGLALARTQVPDGDNSPFQTVRASIDGGRYAQAEAEAERLVSILEQVNASTSRVERATDLLVEALISNGKGPEPRARQLAERVVRGKESRAEPFDQVLAPSLRNLGDVLVEQGEYGLARPLYERARQIHERVLGTAHPEVADDLDRLAHLLLLVEKYDEALALSERALGIKERSLDAGDVRIARTLEVRAQLFQRKADYPNARKNLERALAIREPANPVHPETADSLSYLGEQLTFEGDLVEAKQVSLRALRLAEETLRPDHPQIASHLSVLAASVGFLGDLAGARALRERALAIAEKSFGPDHPVVAMQLNDLAVSFFLDGNYTQAYALYDRARSAYERRLGPENSYVATEVYNLAIASEKLGDYATARRLFNRAISTWEGVVGPDHPFVAMAVSELARMLSSQGLDSEARVLYERALAIRERTLGKNHYEVARTLTRLSTTVAKLGQSQQAYEISTRALTIFDQSSEHETQSVAEAYRVHGTHQASRGDYMGAYGSYERALLTLRRVVGPSHPDVAEAQVGLATALVSLGDTSTARHNALEAEEIGRNHLSLMLANLPERRGLEYAVKRPRGLDLALSFGDAGDGNDNAGIVDELIRSRALILDELAIRRHVSADAARLDLTTSWDVLVAARQRYANLAIRGSGELDVRRRTTLLDQARREKESAEIAVAEKSAAFRTELSRAQIGLKEVREALPSDGAILSFARYDREIIDRPRPAATLQRSAKPVPSYIAMIIRSSTDDASVVPLGRAADIDNLIAEWRRQTIGVVGAISAADAERSYRAAGANLRRRVWDPLRQQLKGAKTVFIVPDGMLSLVSFAALPIGQLKYLIDEGPVIHYLSAERDLVSSPTSTTATRGLLAVGGAAFNDATLFARTSKPASTPAAAKASPDAILASVRSSSSDTLRAGCGSLQTMQFTPLAGTSREVRDVAALWIEDSPAQVLEGRDASEQAFKREAPGHRVLHLATHGFFLGDDCAPAVAATRSVGALTTGQTKTANRPIQPKRNDAALIENPLLMSGLALAGANRRSAARPDEDDGILTAEEVSALNLEGVEWAVLSACDTGLGEVKAGEGVFGLRRAFQVAGVRTVIMSLWPVDDQATRVWMRALYQGRLQKRLTTADAMHQASLSVLQNRRANHQSTHPFYWAAFVAAGDWK
jgi:CHAT domain-containing protein/tetratricopeptide (TPR) repeat protein